MYIAIEWREDEREFNWKYLINNDNKTTRGKNNILMVLFISTGVCLCKKLPFFDVATTTTFLLMFNELMECRRKIQNFWYLIFLHVEKETFFLSRTFSFKDQTRGGKKFCALILHHSNMIDKRLKAFFTHPFLRERKTRQSYQILGSPFFSLMEKLSIIMALFLGWL